MMKLLNALLNVAILSSIFFETAAATPWRQILSSRVNTFYSRADGNYDAEATFKKVQASCPQPDLNNAGQQMTEMAEAASSAMDDLVNGRQNDKALNMYNSAFGVEPDELLRNAYYGQVKGALAVSRSSKDTATILIRLL